MNIREVHNAMIEAKRVQVPDGRTGIIYRIETDYPVSVTTVRVALTDGKRAKCSPEELVLYLPSRKQRRKNPYDRSG